MQWPIFESFGDFTPQNLFSAALAATTVSVGSLLLYFYAKSVRDEHIAQQKKRRQGR